jgi:hypothetical protein
MVSAVIEKRLTRLEQTDGGDECPRCTRTMVIFGPGCDEPAVNRRGVQLGREESKRFYEEEQPGDICPYPLCHQQRQRIRVGWGQLR